MESARRHQIRVARDSYDLGVRAETTGRTVVALRYYDNARAALETVPPVPNPSEYASRMRGDPEAKRLMDLVDAAHARVGVACPSPTSSSPRAVRGESCGTARPLPTKALTQQPKQQKDDERFTTTYAEAFSVPPPPKARTTYVYSAPASPLKQSPKPTGTRVLGASGLHEYTCSPRSRLSSPSAISAAVTAHAAPIPTVAKVDGTEAKGMENPTGARNCFLNSLVQCLWHTGPFAERILTSVTHKPCHVDSCAFCSLRQIFEEYKFGDEQSIPPTALRVAMSRVYSEQHRFQLGEMEDAVEALDSLLILLHDAECSEEYCVPSCVAHETFGQFINERFECERCTFAFNESRLQRFVLYASASRLMEKQRDSASAVGLDKLLQLVITDEVRRCPECGGTGRGCQYIVPTMIPSVFVVGIVWSQHFDVFSSVDTANALSFASASIRLSTFLRGSPDSRYFLRAIICYYGKHYSALVCSGDSGTWRLFDDTVVRTIGKWSDVSNYCSRGHLRPSALIYEQSI